MIEELEIICSIVTALSTIIIAIQLFQTAQAEKKHHEEMRRIKTVEIMENWSKSLRKEASFAEKIVKDFTPKQCRALFMKEGFELDKETGKKICQICGEKEPELSDGECKKCMSDGKYRLEGAQLSEFRWYVVGYLNMLESVMTAWNLNIVDQEEIEKQFQYLYNPDMGWNALQPFRDAAGGVDSYPNIDKFMKKIESKQNKGSREREKL